MARELVLGLDLGTTSIKAVLFEPTGKLIAEAEEMVKTNYPHPGWAEQDPRQVEQAAMNAVNRVVQQANAEEEEIIAAGFSAAMHSLICLNEQVEPISPMIIWADGRSSKQAEHLMNTNGLDIFQRTGTPIHPMTPFLKLCWMKDTGYKAYKEARYFMSMKEYLIYRWFGKRWIDYSMAAATGLFDVKKLQWDEEALQIAGVKEEQLSEIVPPTTILSNMDKETATKLGLSTAMPFVIGAADGQLANLGSGAIAPLEANISVGTSGAIRQFVQGAPVNEKMETFTYPFTAETSIIGGPTNNGGIVLQWLKETVEFKGTHEEFLAGAENVSIGSEGIIFLPYINGERAPLWNEQAKGNFFGLRVGHRKEHLTRAVLEGIAFNIYQISESLERVAGAPKKISVNGGLSKSNLWVQIMADVFGKNIHVSNTHHNAAWGAAWTALVGTGRAKAFEDIRQSLPPEKVVKPNMEKHQKYQEIYSKYEELALNLSQYF